MSWGSTSDRHVHGFILLGMDEIRVQETSPDGKQRVLLFRDYTTEDEYGSPVLRTALEQVDEHRSECEAAGVLVEVIG